MEGVADADTGGDGPACVGCVKLEYEGPSHLRQGRGGSDRRATTMATL